MIAALALLVGMHGSTIHFHGLVNLTFPDSFWRGRSAPGAALTTAATGR